MFTYCQLDKVYLVLNNHDSYNINNSIDNIRLHHYFICTSAHLTRYRYVNVS